MQLIQNIRLTTTSSLLLVILLLGTAGKSYSQSANFQDGFEDGDFTSNPAWSGNMDDFEIIYATPNHLLHLNAVNSSPAYLSTSSSSVVGTWEFYVEYRNNAYSNSNQVNIFLMSDIADLTGSVNGYAIQVGQSGDDYFKIIRFDGGSEAATVLTGTTVVDSDSGYTVRVTRDASGNWQMKIAKGYGTSYNAPITGTDNTYTTTSYFGPRVDFSSSRFDKFYFDFNIDRPPFNVTDASVNGSRVDVSFNRDYNQNTVEATDFNIDNGIGSPSSVNFPSPTVVRLNYGSSFASGEYTVSVQHVQDQFGSDVATGASASCIVYDSYADGDVIINEFVYDPGSGQSEYVEIKNLSGKFLNLRNWELGDETGSNVISSDTLALQPNGFLVISSDTTTLFNTYGSRSYVEPGNVPSFNNSEDVIKLLMSDGNRVDSLQYASDWGGNNVALERRSGPVPSVYKENFGDSPNPQGGTPGIANEVPHDTTPPSLDDFTITNNQTLDLNFSERVENTGATTTGNYSLDNGINISSAQQTAADSVQLHLSSPLKNGAQYQLTVANQQDIFGNTAATTDSSFTYYKPTPADTGDIFINEFMYNPPAGSEEYIELSNPTSKSFDLSGWTLSDNRGTRETIISSRFIVPPDSFVVMAPDSSLLEDHPNIAIVTMGTAFPSLNDGGDAIAFYDDSGELLDSLVYESDWGSSGIALERRTTDVAPVQSNFGDAPNGFGTPGETNDIPEDTTPPNINDFSIASDQSLQFVFSEALDPQTAGDADNYQISGGLNIASATLAGQDSVQVTLSGALQNNTHYTVTVSDVEDLYGNTMAAQDTSFTYYKVSQPDSGDVFINELMYDPPSGSTEYIEFYNASSKSLDLNGWTINDNTGSRQIITNSRFIVPPDSFVVIASDNTLQDDYPGIALITMGYAFPSLNNDGDAITLRDSTGARLDSLIYDNSWGGNGTALERRTVDVAPFQSNFGDAPNGFGTPGSQNDIPKDTAPPDLQDLMITDAQTLVVHSPKN